MLGVKQVEGVGGGEEVVELLIFHVAEQRGAIVVIVRGRVVEEVVGEGVWTGLVSARSGGDGGNWGSIQPNGGGSLSFMAGRGRPAAVAPASPANDWCDSAARLKGGQKDGTEG